MTSHLITQEDVIERSKELPGLPVIVTQIVSLTDNPTTNLNTLVDYLKYEPVIAARVLSLANLSVARSRNVSEIHDIYTATSLIGNCNVRKLALMSSIAGFADHISHTGMANFWQHSVSVGICCEELALHCNLNISSEVALVSGLLHDVGQLWLYYFNAGDFREIWHQSLSHGIGIERAEYERFGVDHSIIGGWMAEYWQLPCDIRNAIRFHHSPDSAPDDILVQLVHVAEVISNALNIVDQCNNQVSYLSEQACQKLGLVWNVAAQQLFGRIDARCRHANELFL